MKLEFVTINRFRSIENINLDNCGDFNVLIGKNNAGKSNILSAISIFFTCIHNGGFATLNPIRARDINFFDRDSQNPIEITLVFSLSLPERDELIHDIVAETPQMKNATNDIEALLQLSTTVRIVKPSSNSQNCFSIVNSIKIYKSYSKKTGERNIVNIDKDASIELYEQIAHFDQDDKDMKGFNRFLMRLEDVTRTGESSSVALRRALTYSSSDMSFSLRRELENMTAIQRSPEEFIKQAKDLYASKKEKFDENSSTNDRQLLHKISTFSGDENSIPNYALNLLKRVSQMKVLYLRERRKQIGKEEAELLLSLKMERGGTKILQNVQNIVFSLLGVNIDAFKRRGEADAEMDIDDFLAEVNGSGVREALRVVLDVLFEEPSILLIEEPEVHLHPALEISMMYYLRQISSKIQIFITTHSTNFLDISQMRNIYLVSKTRSTRVQILSMEDAETKIPQELGMRLSSLFMFDRLVFVEGPTDVSIIREWASIMNVNFSRANVGFIIMGGARNFSYYAAEGTLSFLKKRQVDMWFIIDRDEKSEVEIAKIEKDLGQKAKIKVLGKREIENYLINSQAVTRFIKLKRKAASFENNFSEIDSPSEEEVKITINECAESLKQITTDKRVVRILCKPMYPLFKWEFDREDNTSIAQKITHEYDTLIQKMEETKQKIEVTHEYQKQQIEGIWNERKLDLVPGDILLDLVCKKYGVRFKKDIDGPRLASLMAENEIDMEIKGIIREISD